MGMSMGMGGMGGMGMGMGYQPSFQPMYANQAMQQHAPQVQTPEQQLQMDAAFDQAFKDAQLHMGQDQAQANEQEHEQAQPQELQQEEAPAEEIREAKGDFEKVWESLKPEAERLGKLAEWEKEFSQVSSDASMMSHHLDEGK
jgi:peroxin-5